MIIPPSDIGSSQEVSHIAFLLPPRARGAPGHKKAISAYWNIGILEYRPIGILGYWDIGILEYWNIGILGCWDLGILNYWDTGNIGITHSIVMRRTELDRVMPWRERVQ